MLTVRGATRRFGRRRVFAGLDLDLAAGERILLAGPNGSGKTTLLRCLAGTLGLSAGSVTVADEPVGSRASRSRVGLCLSPEQGLYTRLSAHENLLFAARLRLPAGEVAGAVADVQDELDITPYAGERVQDCSSGMRSRVALARALLGHPTLLLLDEPTRSLDTDATERLWSALARRQVACVVASHSAGDRERCSRALQLPVLG